MLLAALELVLISVMIIFLITQVFYPFFRGTQLFPILRKEAKIQSSIERVNQKVVEKELAETLKEKLKGLK